MNYTQTITSAPVVLVEFYASWCPHCQRMMPVVAKLKEELENRVKVYQLDIDQNQDTADKENVESIPTFILYKGGKEQWRHSGEMDGKTLLADVEKNLNP